MDAGTQPSGWRCEPFGWRHAVVCRPRTRLGWQKITEVGRFRTLSGLGLDAALPAIRAFLKSRGRDAPRFSDFGEFLPSERERGGLPLGRHPARRRPLPTARGKGRLVASFDGKPQSPCGRFAGWGSCCVSVQERCGGSGSVDAKKAAIRPYSEAAFRQNPSKQRGRGVRRSQARRFGRRALAGKERGGARSGSRGRGEDNVSSL